ncbi:MAG TPA: hypothetical protein QF624_08700 [Dehalococcoidia bacterium]|nr:hypothetical protein [Dehalococcoidia bacterium]
MNELPSASAPDLFVARQPIFTERLKVHGYELLFRSGAENVFPNVDGNIATADLIGNVIGTLGLDTLTGGKLAFVNFTRSMLVGEYYRLLPPERMVIELLEDVEPDEDVIAASKRLKDAGYTLALETSSASTIATPPSSSSPTSSRWTGSRRPPRTAENWPGRRTPRRSCLQRRSKRPQSSMKQSSWATTSSRATSSASPR